jgi:hypothetical protein
MLSSVDLADLLKGGNEDLSGPSHKNWLTKAGAPNREKVEDPTAAKAEDEKRKKLGALFTNIFSRRREDVRKEDREEAQDRWSNAPNSEASEGAPEDQEDENEGW